MPSISLDEPGHVVLIWVVAFALCLAALALGLTGLIRPKVWRRAWAPALGAAVLLALLALAVLDSMALLVPSFALPRWGWAVGTLGALVLGWLAPWKLFRGTFQSRPALMSPVLLLAGTLLCGELSWRLEHTCLPELELDKQGLDTVLVPGADVRTDQGTLIPVYTCPEAATPRESLLQAMEQMANRAAPFSAIQVGPPDLRYNCHGWVFAQGAYLIQGDSLPAIFKENGYQKVEQPREGDVIIYSDQQSGRILHSGVVRMTHSGILLVESKWDALGRFLHPPEGQPYSPRYAFFRSARPGHTLAGVRQLDPSEQVGMASAGSPTVKVRTGQP